MLVMEAMDVQVLGCCVTFLERKMSPNTRNELRDARSVCNPAFLHRTNWIRVCESAVMEIYLDTPTLALAATTP